MRYHFLLAGEPLALMIAQESGTLDTVSSYRSAVAGAELNVAIGLARLDHSVCYMSKLGDDPFARRIRHTISENGIETNRIMTDPQHPTGMMLKAKTDQGDPDIFYFRRGSAASFLSRQDVEQIDFTGFQFLHLTGIFPALSAVTRDAADCLVKRARKNGLTISFDPNLRPQLWNSVEEMRQTINHFAFQADLFLPGRAEGEMLTGLSQPEEIAAFYLRNGTKTVLVKTGKQGAYGTNGRESLYCPAFQETGIVDTVGAGDGFAAGALSAYAEGLPLAEMLRRANAIGTMQIQSEGDNEGLPTRPELDTFLANTPYRQEEN